MGQLQLKNIISTFPQLKDYQLKYEQRFQFEGQFVQRIKETPFVNSICYNTQPSIFIQQVQPDLTLRMLVQPRLNTMKLFPYEQILKILQNCLSGLKQLKDRQFQYYGNISLQNIYYSKNSKTFKIVNPIFNQQTNYQQAKLNIKFSFLSPQQLLAMTQNSFEAESSFISDIFILGIVLLEVCTLTQSSEIYCPQTYNIFDLQIKNRLINVNEYYPPQIAQILSLCLEYDFQARIQLEDLLKKVKSIRKSQIQQSNIQGMKQGPPQKLQNMPRQNLISSQNIQNPSQSYYSGYNTTGNQLISNNTSQFQTPKK